MSCSFDPTIYKDSPIGMFNCPECNKMVMAGLPHPNYDIDNKTGFERVDVVPVKIKYPIWQDDRSNLEVYSDGEKFVVEILSGMAETYLAVGYSCPNGANISYWEAEKVQNLTYAVDAWWNAENRYKSLDDMLPTMLEMAKFTNKAFNAELSER